ncbi:MAG TPA: ATP-binding protein [Casimicrobiaceae bacterium]|nr:ATP-binding protein [Casimicrobiaceae bacterium]
MSINILLEHIVDRSRRYLRETTTRVQRPELEQTALRVLIAAVVMVYLFWYALRDGRIELEEAQVLTVSVGFFLFSIVLAARVFCAGGASVKRRLIGMLADNAVTTYCLMNMGEGGAVVIGVYLFITFGNGFRFGRLYLHACQCMGIIGFSAVLVLSPFWSQHAAIGAGFLIGLMVLPIYVGVLADRIEKAKRRADDANQAKSRFVANVSHEMRTPLNGVIAMADVLRETNLNESQREIVETMTTSAHLLLAQIEDVLDVEKIEAGRVHIETRPFDMGRLLSSTVKVVLPQARYKGLVVNTDVSTDAATWYLGDPHHLRQVVLNLLSNAVKFTERGEVTLRADVIAREGQVNTLRIEVEDTGIGIPLDKQSAIFEPFAQADDSITRVYGGTGLGTTIARHLIGLMGGSIGLSSTPGTGSLFWVELKLARGEAQGIDFTDELSANARSQTTAQALAATQSNKVRKLRGAKILVAEDNPTNQRVSQLILESGGHSVTIVENGELALDALERGGYDLALFDLSMPVVSGLEALKLYKFSTLRPIPVLILSANVTTEIIAECEGAGAAEFIPKPLRASYLLDAIDRHLVIVERAQVAPPPRQEDGPTLVVVDTPALDIAVLRDLEQLSKDATFVERLVRGFKSDNERLLEQISTSLTNRRYEEVRDAAHALKGGAGSVGATLLTQFAARVEKMSTDAMRIRSASLTEELLSISAQTTQALDAYIIEYQGLRAKRPPSG